MGTVAADGRFALKRLDYQGRGRFWQATSQSAPRLEGWVTAAPNGGPGAQLRISYQEAAYGPLLALLAAGAVGLKLLTGGPPWPLALLLAVAAAPLVRLVQRGLLHLEATRCRDRLVEITPLRIVTAASVAAG